MINKILIGFVSRGHWPTRFEPFIIILIFSDLGNNRTYNAAVQQGILGSLFGTLEPF